MQEAPGELGKGLAAGGRQSAVLAPGGTRAKARTAGRPLDTCRRLAWPQSGVVLLRDSLRQQKACPAGQQDWGFSLSLEINCLSLLHCYAGLWFGVVSFLLAGSFRMYCLTDVLLLQQFVEGF